MADAPKITHIALKVTDTEQAAQFYEHVFGFHRTDSRRDGDHFSVHLSDGNFDLALVQFDENSAIGEASGDGPGIHHFGIDVDDTAEMVAKIEAMGGQILHDPSRTNARTIKFLVPGGGGINEIAPRDWHSRKT